MSNARRTQKRSASRVISPAYALMPDEHPMTPNLPEDSISLEASSSTLNESFSPYFSRGAVEKEPEEFSGGTYPILNRLLGRGTTEEADTPGPGYDSFVQHVMDVDGASTPVNSSTPTTVKDVSAMRKLQFESMIQSQSSPRSPRSTPQSLSRNRKRVRVEDDLSASNAVDLRIKPGESGMLAESVLREAQTAHQYKPPQSQSIPSTSSLAYSSQSSKQVLPATSQKTKKQAPLKLTDFYIPPIYPITEETVLSPPQGISTGTKEVKLRDNFSTAEFVDLLVHDKTLTWDIIPDPITRRLRATFYQRIA